jgi:hypothetical protein
MARRFCVYTCTSGTATGATEAAAAAAAGKESTSVAVIAEESMMDALRIREAEKLLH